MGQKLCAQGDAPLSSLTTQLFGLVSPPFSTHVRFQQKNLKRNVTAREGEREEDFFVRSGLLRRRGGGGKASLPTSHLVGKGEFTLNVQFLQVSSGGLLRLNFTSQRRRRTRLSLPPPPASDAR